MNDTGVGFTSCCSSTLCHVGFLPLVWVFLKSLFRMKSVLTAHPGHSWWRELQLVVLLWWNSRAYVPMLMFPALIRLSKKWKKKKLLKASCPLLVLLQWMETRLAVSLVLSWFSINLPSINHPLIFYPNVLLDDVRHYIKNPDYALYYCEAATVIL